MRFTNPDFLWALTLILLPIIIHLFNFKRFKKVYFSNLQFLKTVEQQTKRHSQLRHFLVLISRILFVIFLVMAFAKPFILHGNKDKVVGIKKRVVVFLDNSFSMQQKGRRGVLLEEGRIIAKEIAQSFNPTDKFRLINNDVMSFEGTFLSREDYMSDLRDCDFQSYSLPLSSVISELSSQANLNEDKPTDLFIISDFQKSTTDVSQWIIDSNINLWIVPLTSSSADNIYTDSCWLDEPVPFKDKPLKIHFLLAKNFDKDAQNVRITLIVNGIQKGITTLDLTQRKQEVEFSFRPDSSKIQLGSLEIQDYPISFDNKFFFSFMVRKNFVVTLLNGEKEPNFIQRFYDHDSSINLRNYDQNQIDYSSFLGSDVLILNQLTKFSSGFIDEVKKYLENGGRIVFIPSSKASMEETNNFNRHFKLPIATGIDTSKLFLGDMDLHSALFRDVFDVKNDQLPENIDLPYFKFRNKLYWPAKGNDKVLMSFENGIPFLVSKSFGSGELFYFSAAINTENSNLGRHAIFIPLFYNFALTVNSNNRLYFPVAEEQITLMNVHAQKESAFHIREVASQRDFIPNQQETSGETKLFLEGQIHAAGNFILSNSDMDIAPLSFNYPNYESNLDNYQVSDIKELIKKQGIKNAKILDNKLVNIGDELKTVDQGVQLWKIFILLAILLLLIEVFLLRFLK